MDVSEEGGQGPLSPELHLHVQQEVPGHGRPALDVDGASVGVEFARAEVSILVAGGDGDADVVPGERRRRAHAEDQGRDQDVGLEAQMVEGDPSGRGLAGQEV